VFLSPVSFSIALTTNVVQKLAQCVEDQDVESFTTEVKSFDQVSRLEQWHTTILLKIKKQIPDPDDIN